MKEKAIDMNQFELHEMQLQARAILEMLELVSEDHIKSPERFSEEHYIVLEDSWAKIFDEYRKNIVKTMNFVEGKDQ